MAYLRQLLNYHDRHRERSGFVKMSRRGMHVFFQLVVILLCIIFKTPSFNGYPVVDIFQTLITLFRESEICYELTTNSPHRTNDLH